MNFIKRAWFAVKRKPGRTIVLLIIFFVVANLVLAGISINRATKQASQSAKQQLGSTLTLSFDMQSAMQKAMSSSSSSTSSSSDNRGRFNIIQQPLTEAMIKQVSIQKNILDYNIIVSTTAMAKNFSAVQTSTSSSSSSAATTNNNAPMGGNQSNDSKANANFTMPDVTITGLRSTELYSDFSSNSVSLSSGSHITENQAGKNVAVISSELASANSLKIGDTINISATGDTTSRAVKIIGVFKTSNSSTNTGTGSFGNFNTSYSSAYNTIYVDYKTALTLKDDRAAVSSSSSSEGFKSSRAPQIDSAVYYLSDPSKQSSTISDIKNIKSIDWSSFSISSESSTYESMVSAITKVGSFASIFVIVVSIIGAAILALILLLNVRERMFETGVLLAMGEARIKIVLQYAAEMLMIAVVAFSISYFSGGYIGQRIGNYLVTSTISSSSTVQQVGQGQGGQIGQGGGTQSNRLNQMRSFGGVNRNVNQISKISVNVTPIEVLELSLAGILIILLATVVPLISIMRYKPRSILTRAG